MANLYAICVVAKNGQGIAPESARILAEAYEALQKRLTVAEAVISRAAHCVREEYERSEVLKVLNNPLPPHPVGSRGENHG